MAMHRVKTYTKRDIALRAAELCGEKLSKGVKWTDATFQALREKIMKADPELRVEVRDFGVFEVKVTKSKPKARNPRTGETIYVLQHRKSHFKAGKILKEFLSKSLDEHPDHNKKGGGR